MACPKKENVKFCCILFAVFCLFSIIPEALNGELVSVETPNSVADHSETEFHIAVTKLTFGMPETILYK